MLQIRLAVRRPQAPCDQATWSELSGLTTMARVRVCVESAARHPGLIPGACRCAPSRRRSRRHDRSMPAAHLQGPARCRHCATGAGGPVHPRCSAPGVRVYARDLCEVSAQPEGTGREISADRGAPRATIRRVKDENAVPQTAVCAACEIRGHAIRYLRRSRFVAHRPYVDECVYRGSSRDNPSCSKTDVSCRYAGAGTTEPGGNKPSLSAAHASFSKTFAMADSGIPLTLVPR